MKFFQSKGSGFRLMWSSQHGQYIVPRVQSPLLTLRVDVRTAPGAMGTFRPFCAYHKARVFEVSRSLWKSSRTMPYSGTARLFASALQPASLSDVLLQLPAASVCLHCWDTPVRHVLCLTGIGRG